MFLDQIIRIRYFLLLSLLYWIVGSLILIFIPKGEITLLINQFHNNFLDIFFIAATWIGEIWITLAIIASIILFYNIYLGIGTGVIMIFTGIIVQSLKRLIFADYMRPAAFFEDTSLYVIDGLQIHTMYSFPSGHTTSAFALFTLLALLTKNKKLHILFFISAFLVGLSRIYLAQHFFMDTYFGSLLGITCALVLFYVFKKFLPAKENSKLNKPVFGLRLYNENTAHIH